MTLDRRNLRESISHLFRPEGMPRGSVPDAVREWVTSYSKYGQLAIAGGTLPSSLIPTSGPDGRFSDSLDAALRNMWSAVLWTGPSLVGTTLFIPPLAPILESSSRIILGSRDPELALSVITDALHTYTLSITVSVVPPTGTAVIVPLT